MLGRFAGRQSIHLGGDLSLRWKKRADGAGNTASLLQSGAVVCLAILLIGK